MSPQPIKNYVPVIDTLHFNLTGIDFLSIIRTNAQPSYQSDCYELERVEKRNPNFHLIYSAKFNGTPFGTLYLDRKSPFSNQRLLMPFHLLNSTLYTNWIPVFTNFMAAFELTISTYSQVHIAFDTNQNIIKAFYKLQDSPDFVMNHGRQLSDTVKTAGKRQAGGQREDSLYIGSTKSAKHTVMYNKTDEIERSGKDYITAHHRANGLGDAPVYRGELKLTHDVLKDYRKLFVNEDAEFMSVYRMKRQAPEEMPDSTYQLKRDIIVTELDYRQFQNPAYLSSLFSLFTNLDFRHNDNKNISRCTKYAFIDFNKYQKEIIMQKHEYKDVIPNNFRTQKQSLDTQIELYKRTANPVLMVAAAAYAAAYGLQSHLTYLVHLYNLAGVVGDQFPNGYIE